MLLDHVLIGIIALCLAVVVYHHAAYPILLRLLGSKSDLTASSQMAAPRAEMPSIAIIVPAHNEANVIAAKIRNLREFDYPSSKLRIVLVFDGCIDATVEVARLALATLADARHFSMVEHRANIGKIAVLNSAIADCGTDLVALTDASAIVSRDALVRAQGYFADPAVGVVCAVYDLNNAGSAGDRLYWRYQANIKLLEASLAAPIGAHGAFYMLRRHLWQPLPPDTINDDFFIPMRIALAGHRIVYDPAIVATEVDQSTLKMEFGRRMRIGAGNIQQLIRLPQLLNPARGYLAFLFVSGKGLRALLPFVLLCGAVSALLLVIRLAPSYWVATGIVGAGVASVVLALRARARGRPAILSGLGYFLEGHFASGLGAVAYLTRRNRTASNSWSGLSRPAGAVPVAVAISKRLSDLILGSVLLVALAVAVLPVAVAIKIDGRRRIIRRERCAGAWHGGEQRTFLRIRFETMPNDFNADGAHSEPDEQSISRVGRWLRRSGFDALPQCVNVLLGDMTIVGPRPVRPETAEERAREMPSYWAKTHGLKPGMTGLAQLERRPATADRAQADLAHDIAYAERLSSWPAWLGIDIRILCRTVVVGLQGKRR